MYTKGDELGVKRKELEFRERQGEIKLATVNLAGVKLTMELESNIIFLFLIDTWQQGRKEKTNEEGALSF